MGMRGAGFVRGDDPQRLAQAEQKAGRVVIRTVHGQPCGLHLKFFQPMAALQHGSRLAEAGGCPDQDEPGRSRRAYKIRDLLPWHLN